MYLIAPLDEDTNHIPSNLGFFWLSQSLFLASNICKTINQNQNLLCLNPVFVPIDKSRFRQSRKRIRTRNPVVVVAADFREAIVKKFDAFADQIGRNVVLELYSTDIDPKTRAPKKSKESLLKDWSQKSTSLGILQHFTRFVSDEMWGWNDED
ncbi:hypothetical protein L6452_03811 [Arctium lappa]|uniref:Uncharacterized protein n=1 Tax=Arctium lappa TaxID=4217 RepID=A0ACB9FP64_ARCLA|nr:hypothetical protein L6452_03811 [Arctium lappa]